MERIETIKQAITEPLNKIEVIVDHIEFVESGKTHSLNITLDKVNGIDLDTIVEATHIINPILDELDLIEESYVLDVSSKERG